LTREGVVAEFVHAPGAVWAVEHRVKDFHAQPPLQHHYEEF
jgi:hypothetical protein